MFKILNKVAQKKSKLRIGLALKFTIIISVLILLVASISTILISWLGYNALKSEIKNKLQIIASGAATIIDTEKIKKINTEEDQESDEYKELQQKIQAYKESTLGKVRYLYTYKKDGDKYVFVLDASSSDSQEHSAPGSEFDLSEYPVALNGFTSAVSEEEPSLDVEFDIWSQSGYAPIKDKSGQVIGAVGVDIDVTTLKQDEEKLNTAVKVALGISLLLAILLSILFSKYLTKPIFTLIKGTQKVAEGDLSGEVVIERKDEFGQLANAFNKMTQDLKVSRDSLEEYNAELEKKVEERTSQLSQINREIKDILDNMSQAIFTIDKDFLFNEQHSRFAYNIFGEMELAGRNICDVFFPSSELEKSKLQMSEWLNRVFACNNSSWENIEALQPVRESYIKRIGNDGKESTKYIQIDFQPIIDIVANQLEERVLKVMVILQDITEKKTLELEMANKEKEYKDNLSQIIEVINADRELFQDFIVDCQENIANFEPQLIQLKDNKENMELINELFRIMHTIKGNAKIFNLEKIAGQAHSIENIFSAIRKGESILTDELLGQIFAKLDVFNMMFNETFEIYEKITSGKSVGSNDSENQEKQKSENEVIKIKVVELNRLAGLIKIAGRILSDEVPSLTLPRKNNEHMEKVQNIIKETQEQIKSMSKMNLSRLFSRFPRMVRDTSIELGKKVKLLLKGENIDIERNIFDKLADPLVHIIRNSLDHGLEIPSERKENNKKEEGTITLSADLTDTELIVTIEDDGRGLDLDRIKAKAVKKGLITADIAMHMPDSDAINLIFAAGFSTNEKVTELSGRGVGMDVVKTSIEENLKGMILMETIKGKGLKVKLTIPLENNLESIQNEKTQEQLALTN